MSFAFYAADKPFFVVDGVMDSGHDECVDESTPALYRDQGGAPCNGEGVVFRSRITHICQ